MGIQNSSGNEAQINREPQIQLEIKQNENQRRHSWESRWESRGNRKNLFEGYGVAAGNCLNLLSNPHGLSDSCPGIINQIGNQAGRGSQELILRFTIDFEIHHYDTDHPAQTHMESQLTVAWESRTQLGIKFKSTGNYKFNWEPSKTKTSGDPAGNHAGNHVETNKYFEGYGGGAGNCLIFALKSSWSDRES